MCCEGCGEQLNGNAAFCPECGTNAAPADDDNLVGWSPHADASLFRQHARKYNKNMMITGFVMGAIEIIALGIYGWFDHGGENFIPLLCVGCGLAVFSIIWALKHSYARGNTENWEGTVADKRVAQKKRRVYDDPTDGDSFSWQKYAAYEIVIQRQDGKYHITSREDSFVFDNYAIGDRVRWHGAISYLEKYDKRNSRYIFCAKCGNDCDPKLDSCDHCAAPLLKGAGRAHSNSPPPGDPDKGVKFIGFDEKVPRRGSYHLRNWILGTILALLIIGLGRCSELQSQKMNRQAATSASVSSINSKK